jgi:two-component system, OmpR family, response regulator QseB
MRILIVEDDGLLAQGLKQGLLRCGYTVDIACSAEEAQAFLDVEAFDMALVDIGLPGADGLQLIRGLRAKGIALPVLVLTARGNMDDVVQGLDAGADDYIAKPYRLPEVAARMRALIRRSNAISTAILRHGGLALDTKSRTARLDGEAVELTNREWAIL